MSHKFAKLLYWLLPICLLESLPGHRDCASRAGYKPEKSGEVCPTRKP